MRRWNYWKVIRGWRLWTLLAIAVASCMQVSVIVDTVGEFPGLTPAALAHYLSDFSNHPPLYEHIGSWSIENESNNYTSWRYVVRYECGPRCSGRAVVTTSDAPSGRVPQHGLPETTHRVCVKHEYCTRLPVLPWPQFCGEKEIEAVVTSKGSGALYTETARTRCAVLQAVSGGCSAELKEDRDTHLQRLRIML